VTRPPERASRGPGVAGRGGPCRHAESRGAVAQRDLLDIEALPLSWAFLPAFSAAFTACLMFERLPNCCLSVGVEAFAFCIVAPLTACLMFLPSTLARTFMIGAVFFQFWKRTYFFAAWWVAFTLRLPPCGATAFDAPDGEAMLAFCHARKRAKLLALAELLTMLFCAWAWILALRTSAACWASEAGARDRTARAMKESDSLRISGNSGGDRKRPYFGHPALALVGTCAGACAAALAGARRGRGVLAGALGLLLLAGCGEDTAGPPGQGQGQGRWTGGARPGEPDTRPDVLLLVIDTLRADRTGALQSAARDNTPELTALGARGVTYRQAVAPAAWTLPSMAALMAGRDVAGNRHAALPDERTLAERFAAGGWHTAGVSANPLLTADNGFARGFDSFTVAPAASTASLSADVHELRAWDAQALAERALALLAAAPRDRPVFLFLQLMDPHVPYDPLHAQLAPPEPGWSAAPLDAWSDALDAQQAERLAGWRRAYDGQVRFADAALGRLLSRLGDVRRRPALVAVTADHGEGLGSHAREADSPPIEGPLGAAYMDHGEQLHEEALRVPLWIAGPGVPAGHDERRPVPTVLLGPTLLALAGLEPGGPRLPLAPGDAVPALVCSTGTRGWSARSATRKLVVPFPERFAHPGVGPRLYDVEAVLPGLLAPEREDLAAREPAVLSSLADACEAWRRAATASPDALDPATEERLRALGYIR
jgi:arylsulfatase A-like enzyme